MLAPSQRRNPGGASILTPQEFVKADFVLFPARTKVRVEALVLRQLVPDLGAGARVEGPGLEPPSFQREDAARLRVSHLRR